MFPILMEGMEHQSTFCLVQILTVRMVLKEVSHAFNSYVSTSWASVQVLLYNTLFSNSTGELAALFGTKSQSEV